MTKNSWYHFRVELGGKRQTELWVSGEETVADAQEVANRRARNVFPGTARIKFCHQGYYEGCNGE